MKAELPVLRGHVPFAWLSCSFCAHRRAQETHQASERGAAISKSLAPSSRSLWFAGLEGVENLGADRPRPGAPGALRRRRSLSQRFNDRRRRI
jgi:hypothetical protein